MATVALCAAGTIGSCGPATSGEQPTSTVPVSHAEPSPSTHVETPETRIQSYFAAFDASAAKGWPDTAYNREFLTPDLAVKADADDKHNTESGAIITGERKLSEWTVLEEDDTHAVVEFCNDTRDQTATKDGQPVDISNASDGEGVAKFTLARDSKDVLYLISEMGYYPEGTTCADHFAQYDK